ARMVGSPPVIFSPRTPRRTNSASSRVSSSNVSSSSLGSHWRPSAGMQYVHRKLHRSVTEIRRSSAIRPKVSRSGPSAGAGRSWFFIGGTSLPVGAEPRWVEDRPDLLSIRAVRVLILYESRRGFTLTVARALRDELRKLGTEATTAPLRGVDAGTLA